MTLRIQLENASFRPGQVLDLTVEWDFELTPSLLVLDLAWQTSGKGTDDSETVYSEKWEPETKSGHKRFRIPLPRGPISVRGNLISIDWHLECNCQRPRASCMVPIVLSQIDGPVMLSQTASQSDE